MIAFDCIEQAALARVGGAAALQAELFVPRTVQQLKGLSEAVCLSNMTRRIFQAGLNRQIIDNKWQAFEAVFHAFDIDAVRAMADESLEQLMADQRIVRHWRKIQSVRHNAETIHAIRLESGSFVEQLAEWQSAQIVDYWLLLKKRFKQLGGASGAYFLRRIKKDTFLLTSDVVRAMFYWGAIDEPPKNQRQYQQVQDCMNVWQQTSGRPYCQISQILALSIG